MYSLGAATLAATDDLQGAALFFAKALLTALNKVCVKKKKIKKSSQRSASRHSGQLFEVKLRDGEMKG